MKTLFSSSWNSSVQPRKQKKYRHEAPLHIKHKFLSAHLSKELRQKYGKRSLPLRKGDEVLVMRGGFRKKQAKIVAVNKHFSKIYLEGIQRSKKDGTKVQIPFNPRILKLISLNLDDKERMNSVNKHSESMSKTAESTVSKSSVKVK